MTTICFDLDGTLLDPMEGIHDSLRFACEGMGIANPEPREIAPYIGLDLESLFRALPGLSDDSRRKAAMSRFWFHFGEEGVFAQRVQEGAHLMLARLKRQGHRLFLVTGQPATHARLALHHFDLNLIFDDVIGPCTREPWRSKREILETLARDGALRSGGLMIGDRGDDIRGGEAHGLRTLGAAYGYGSRDELESARAGVIMESIRDLDAWLAEVLTGPEIHDPFSRSE